MNKRLGMVSLGCSKNRVDSELILGRMKNAGFDITPSIAEADVVIVNTCGFITPAKEESINAILEAARDKRAECLLAVCGCLSQRYPGELREELPEIDILWGVGDHEGLANAICERMGIKRGGERPLCGRILTTPAYSAYLRIADGCDNRCAYCAIPLIRGGRRSAPMEDIVEEARELAARGASELTLIAQDTSAYGSELYGKPMLSELLRRLSPIEGVRSLRVLYAYPNTVNEELVDTMLSISNVAKYIDMPIQHIDPAMLERMNRHGSAEHIRYITDYIRRASSDFILRTTVMTGFPGEDEAAFGRLAEFIEEHPFDRLGAFAFSPEDGTPAAEMPDQVDAEIAEMRLEKLMKKQREISLALNRKRVGKTYEVLVEKTGGGAAMGRSYAEAPEVDGLIAISGLPDETKPGDYVRVKISGAGPYDLKGEYVK